MELKKSKKVSLEKKKFLFLEIGLVVIAAVSLVAFEWTSSLDNGEELAEAPEREYTMEHAQVAPPEPEKKMEAPPKALEQLVFKVVDEDVIVEKQVFTIIGEGETFEFPDLGEEDPVVDEVFFRVEEMPLFQKQHHNYFSRYIGENLEYPQGAIRDQISGKVYIQFTVNDEGNVVDAIVYKSVDPELDQEALRVVNSSPKWIPGKQRGRAVNVRFVFPITFILN